MSIRELKKYFPDSPKEFSFFGTALVSLGSSISGCLVVTDHDNWSIVTILITWLGYTMEKYFKLHEDEDEKKSTVNEPKK